MICASRLPPQIAQIAGGDTPVFISPIPISTQVRRATILDPEDPLYEDQENYSADRLGVDGYHLEGSGAIWRSHNHHEHEHTRTVLPQNREDFTSGCNSLR